MTRDEGVKLIRDMMTRDEWTRGASGKAFAAQHGVKLDTVQHWSSEASRQVRMAMPDSDYIAAIEERLSDIAESAKQEGKYGASVQALRAMVECRGLQAKAAETMRNEVEAMSLADQVRILVSEPEMRAALIEALYELRT